MDDPQAQFTPTIPLSASGNLPYHVHNGYDAPLVDKLANDIVKQLPNYTALAGIGVSITAGVGSGSGAGANTELFGGDGGATGAGGSVNIEGGIGGATSGAGGNLTVKAGNAQAGNSNGGDLFLQGGLNAGSGTIGQVGISKMSGAFTAYFNPESLTADRQLTIQDKAGTLALTSDIPAAFTPTYTSNIDSHDVSTTGGQTIAHGLGKAPKFVRIVALGPGLGSSVPASSEGTYNGTVQCNVNVDGLTANTNSNNSQIITLNKVDGTNPHNATATIAFDATNITLTWSKNSTPTGTASFMWECYA